MVLELNDKVLCVTCGITGRIFERQEADISHKLVYGVRLDSVYSKDGFSTETWHDYEENIEPLPSPPKGE